MSFKNLIEVFLFVNPLGSECYETEKTILTFSDERDENVRVRFIPLLNFHTMGKHIEHQEKNGVSLEIRNKHYTESYQTCLAFQAASMQGKKKGRKFLLELQKAVVELKNNFSKKIVLEAASNAKLDIETFEEDLASDLVKRSFVNDQKLAQEMSVREAPSCVIFQNTDREYGYRIESTITTQLLHGLCKEETDTPKTQETKSRFKFQMVQN